METKTLTFRKAAASDLDAVTAIYDRLHAQEDAGRVTIGWVTGVYPIRFDAEQALARGDLYVCESEGRVAASGILNQRQVDVYTEGRWAYAAEDRDVFVLHTLTVDPDLSGRGIGCAFVQFYEDTARALGCTVLRMDTNEKKRCRAALIRAARLPGGGHRAVRVQQHSECAARAARKEAIIFNMEGCGNGKTCMDSAMHEQEADWGAAAGPAAGEPQG
ncbi:MAG: GNAT family N-acetyltransferase [Oscillospiraceae bacterium]